MLNEYLTSGRKVSQTLKLLIAHVAGGNYD